jgi:hypothetical protein
MLRRLLAIAVVGGLAALGGACTYGHQEASSGPYQPLVFPGEARLGASAFMVIDSNQFQIGDHLERYDLHRERVRIVVEGNADSADADVRSVFAIETGRATDDAEIRANSWVMVALFDLPDESAGLVTGSYPQHASLHLLVDDVEVPDLEGVIWIVGEDGAPTPIQSGVSPGSIDTSLEPRNMVRLRARDAGSQGFEASWAQIGSIAAEIRFTAPCLADPQVFAGSEAVGSSAFLSTPVAVGGQQTVQLTLVRPRGLQLPAAGTTDPTRLGEGPILDVVFERNTDPGDNCDNSLDQYFEIRNLRVADRDGVALLTDASPADSSEFFHIHYVDPEPR